VSGWNSYLYLEKGHLLEGEGFGAERSCGGEAVFNTGMSGYQEIFTDASYRGQIVVMCYPHIGNTGVNDEDVESGAVYANGVVTREYCDHPSNYRSKMSLGQYLKEAGVPGISGVDTRFITQCLRDEGAQRAVIFSAAECAGKSPAEHGKYLISQTPAMEGLELVSEVSCKTPYLFNDPKLAGAGELGNIVVYDYGVKTNTLRSLQKRGFKVWVVPYNHPHQETLALKPRGIVLSNGPGDPAEVKGVIEPIQGLMGKTPILAICMGHQLLARALGCGTYKLKFGHHGINHPVRDLISDRILITSQNHGFCVRGEDLKSNDVAVSHLSLNDNTVEGFYSEKMKLYSVQFHPESKPGPNDASPIFDYFVRGFLQ